MKTPTSLPALSVEKCKRKAKPASGGRLSR